MKEKYFHHDLFWVCTSLIVLAVSQLSGCATVNWDKRIGHYTKTEAIAELGKPTREEAFDGGGVKMMWKSYKGCYGTKQLTSTTAEVVYFYPASRFTSCVESGAGRGYAEVGDRWLVTILVFDAEDRLKKHYIKKFKGDGTHKVDIFG